MNTDSTLLLSAVHLQTDYGDSYFKRTQECQVLKKFSFEENVK
jgi:hypothetical protein